MITHPKQFKLGSTKIKRTIENYSLTDILQKNKKGSPFDEPLLKYIAILTQIQYIFRC